MDLLRAAGAEVVSSADLAQQFVATWTPEQLAGHRRANVHLHRIVLEAFNRVGDALRRGDEIDEYAVQRFILDAFEVAGLWAESDPIVGVNAHSADPHYQPGPGNSAPIRQGDFLLIDLWAKEKHGGERLRRHLLGGRLRRLADREAAGGLRRRGRRPRRRLGAGRAAAIPTSRCAASRSTTPPAR